VRWKERHVHRLAPLAGLRWLPRWLALGAVAALSLVGSGLIFWDGMEGTGLPAEVGFVLQGLGVLCLAGLLVGGRCSASIIREREQHTWEPLLLTPLDRKHLIRGKLWGAMEAAYPYLFAYAAPALVLSLASGLLACFWVIFCLGMTWPMMYFVGASGLRSSAAARSSGQSLAVTLLTSFARTFLAGWFVAVLLAVPAAALAYFLPFVALGAPSAVRRDAGLLHLFFVLAGAVLAFLLLGLAEKLLEEAEHKVAGPVELELLLRHPPDR
jgi:hypothetical protein